jgi:hypothetical protein
VATTGLALFVDEKLAVADALYAGECGGDYVDAINIMSALLSGIASELWPGTREDKARFIELWVTFSKPASSLISVPLLLQWLRKNARGDEARTIEAARPGLLDDTGRLRVLIGPEVDMSEVELQSLCPLLSTQDMRHQSYPALFYKHVRCGGAHEYEIKDEATPRPMTSRETSVSYSNRLDTATGEQKRLIYFHVPWLRELISVLVRRVDDCPRPGRPQTWWIDGKTA